MRAVRIDSLAGALYLALSLGGCATTQEAKQLTSDHNPAPARQAEDRPNPAGEVALKCTVGSLEMLRAGPLGVPLSIGAIGFVCLPLAIGAGVLHAAAPHLDLGSGAVPDTGPVALRTGGSAELRALTTAERSVFPQSSAGGCTWGDCYAYKTADTGAAGMRKLSSYERAVFPTRFQAGCAAYGYW